MRKLILLITGIILALSLVFFQALNEKDPQRVAIEAILSLYEQYDLVHIGDRHWNMSDYNFRTALVRHPAFAATVDDIVIESGNSRHQDLLDDYVLRLKDVPADDLCKVWRNTVVTTGVWDATIYRQFIQSVREVNEDLEPADRIRLVAADPPIDWSVVNTWDEMSPFLCARSTHAPSVIKSEVINKKRKALIIYGGGHFFRSSDAMACLGRLRTNLEDMIAGKVFVILPLSGDHESSRNFQSEAGVEEYPFFLRVQESKLASRPGYLFFGEANGTLGDFTDGVLYFGPHSDKEAIYDPVTARDTVYLKELGRRQGLR